MWQTKGVKAKATPKITKNFILSKVTEEQIFSYYLGTEVVYGTLICSPLREDKTPTCSFRDTVNGIYFKDFSGDFQGDCFDVVKKIFNCSFSTALKKVAEDFNLAKKTSATFTTSTPLTRKAKRKPKKVFQVKRRNWTIGDRDFWNQYHITRTELHKFNITPIEVLWIDREIKYVYSPTDPAYAYYFGNGKYKIYFPYRISNRFLTNGFFVQGWNQVDLRQNKIIVTKSLKDVVVLDKIGFAGIAPPAEGALLNPELVTFFAPYDMCILFDNDETGITWAKKNSVRYELPFFYLDTYDGNVKDVSDLAKHLGLAKTKEIITKHLTNRKVCQKEE